VLSPVSFAYGQEGSGEAPPVETMSAVEPATGSEPSTGTQIPGAPVDEPVSPEFSIPGTVNVEPEFPQELPPVEQTQITLEQGVEDSGPPEEKNIEEVAALEADECSREAPSPVFCVGAVNLVELLEDTRLVLLRNAGPSVGHAQGEMAVGGAGGDAYPAASVQQMPMARRIDT
jgi:hypothetical protein